MSWQKNPKKLKNNCFWRTYLIWMKTKFLQIVPWDKNAAKNMKRDICISKCKCVSNTHDVWHPSPPLVRSCTPIQVVFCEFWGIFSNIFFLEYLLWQFLYQGLKVQEYRVFCGLNSIIEIALIVSDQVLKCKQCGKN